MTVALFCFDKGARMPDHVLEGNVIIHVLEGELSIRTAIQTHRLSAGKLMVLAPSVAHDITAMKTSRILITFCLEGNGANGWRFGHYPRQDSNLRPPV